MRCGVSGKTAATAATIDHAIAQLWNPSSNRRLQLREIHIAKQAAGGADEPTIRRSTARGTPGSTITPTAVNEFEKALAPASGALLDLAAFTVQPTLEALSPASFVLPNSVGSGVMWVFTEPIWIPAGNGIVITNGVALAFPVSRVTFVWDE